MTTVPTFITATTPGNEAIETFELVDGDPDGLVAEYESDSGHRIELHLDP